MTIGAAIGDTHLGRVLFGFDLTPHTRRIMYRFFSLCLKRGADYAVHLGDLFDSSRPAPGLEKIAVQWANEFERAGIDLFLLTGNHDVISKPGHVSALDAIKAHPYKRVRVIDRPTAIELGQHTGLFLPFPSVATYLDLDDWHQSVCTALQAAKAFKRPVVAYSHLNVSGATWGAQDLILRGGDFSVPNEVLRCKLIRQIVCGHIHVPQRVKRVLIQGAAQRLRIDEADHVRYFYFHRNGKTLHKGKVTIRDAIAMVDLKIDAAVDSSFELENIDINADSEATLINALDGDYNFSGAVVRLQCWANANTVIDWSKVEAHLYEQGALFVYPITPQQKPEEAQGVTVERLATDPDKAARGFIRQRISEKSERIALVKDFKALKEAADV